MAKMMAAGLVILALAGVAGAAQWLPFEGYGNGSDGSLTISSSTTESVIDSSCSGTQNSTTLSASNGSFAVGQIVLIHQTRGSSAGNWELNVIEGYTAGTITTKYPLSYSYATSGANAAQVRVLRQYSSVQVNTGITWTAKAWNGSTGGILAFMCKGPVTVSGTISANGSNGITNTATNPPGATGGGFRGGYGIKNAVGSGQAQSGEGATADRAATSSAVGITGGGGARGDDKGGGGGGYATAGTNGQSAGGGGGAVGVGGGIHGTATLATVVFGGGGGGGAEYSNTAQAGSGASGGGAVLIFAEYINVAGYMQAIGGAGGSGDDKGPGGGAAGGSILIKADALVLTSGRVTATGGVGGESKGYRGGNGGSGRIALYYGTSYNNGTTNPTCYSTQDQALVPNQPPTAFGLTAPANSTQTNSNLPLFSWQASTDPEGLPITYTLLLSEDAGFTQIHRTVGNLSSTSCQLVAGQEIPDGTYYWRVVAHDDEWSVNSSQSWTLTVDLTPPAEPTITGFLSDAVTHETTEIRGNAEAASTLALYRWDGTEYQPVPGNASWNGTGFAFAPTQAIPSGSMLYLTSTDVAANTTASRVHAPSFTNGINVFQDQQVNRQGSGSSLRLEQDTRYQFKIAANGGQQVTISAWLRKNGDYGDGSQPRITLTGPGITGSGSATAVLTAGADTWQQLSVTATPTTAGILTLTVETSSTATNAAAWIDDISVAQ